MRQRVRSIADGSPAVLLCAAPLLLVYLATLAPSVTLWDSGEFLSAVRTLGVPHPPGTPLFVYLAHVWASLLPMVDFTVAVNTGSAIASAIGVAVLARTFVPSHVGSALLAAFVAGTTSVVCKAPPRRRCTVMPSALARSCSPAVRAPGARGRGAIACCSPSSWG